MAPALGRCWVCGEEYFDLDEFEGERYHSPCIRQAEEIDAGLRGKHRQATTTFNVATVRW